MSKNNAKDERNFKTSAATDPIELDDTTPMTQTDVTDKTKNGSKHLGIPPPDVLGRTSSTFSDASILSNVDERYGRLVNGRLRSRSRSPGASNTWKSNFVQGWIRNKGLALVAISQFFGVLMNVTTRLLETEGDPLDPFQILFARMSGTLILSSLYQWWAKVPDAPFGPRQVWPLLIARGGSGFFGVMGLYYSLQYLPLADATVITFLAPLVACWVCSIVLHEPFTRKAQVAGISSFVGVVLIARPASLISPGNGSSSGNGAADSLPVTNGTSSHQVSDMPTVTSSQRLGAVGMALVGVIGAAGAYTTIRWIGKRAHPLVSVNYYAFNCVVISLIALSAVPSITFKLPANARQWFYLIFLGITGFIMQFMLTAGLAYEKSSRATNMVYVQMLFALAFDKLVFNLTPSLLSIAGSSLILGSALCVAVMNNKAKETKKTTSPEGREEEEMGLMANEEAEGFEQHDIQEAQLRTMRT